MFTETSAFMNDTKESIEKQNEIINKFFYSMEEEDFTIQQVKNTLARIEMRVKSASITNDTQTKFKAKLTD